jgi:hypothetical protein
MCDCDDDTDSCYYTVRETGDPKSWAALEWDFTTHEAALFFKSRVLSDEKNLEYLYSQLCNGILPCSRDSRNIRGMFCGIGRNRCNYYDSNPSPIR